MFRADRCSKGNAAAGLPFRSAFTPNARPSSCPFPIIASSSPLPASNSALAFTNKAVVYDLLFRILDSGRAPEQTGAVFPRPAGPLPAPRSRRTFTRPRSNPPLVFAHTARTQATGSRREAGEPPVTFKSP